MAVRPPVAPSTTVAARNGLPWKSERHPELDGRSTEGRAERWATWIIIYLAALVSSLAVGASAWALGLVG